MFVPVLQSLLAKFVIEYKDIIAILNPEEDWDNDTSHLFNERLSSVELKDFRIQLLSGTKSFTQIKDEIRRILQTRPFDRDLIQLQSIPCFQNLPECIAKLIWIEAFLQDFEAQLPSDVWLKYDYGQKLNLETVNLLLDGCCNSELFTMLKKIDCDLIDSIMLEWLWENLTNDKYI